MIRNEITDIRFIRQKIPIYFKITFVKDPTISLNCIIYVIFNPAQNYNITIVINPFNI